MARSWTLAQLRGRLEKLTDTENDTHLSATEKNDYISAAAAETWDKIVSACPDQYVTTQTFSTVAGQLTYDLASVVTAGDFYRVHSLYVDEGNDQYRPIERINAAEVQTFRPPAQVVSMRLYYIPCASTFKTAGSYSDAATFDGINGWEEHTLYTAALAIKGKREEDSGLFHRRKQELEKRIEGMGHADWSCPGRVVRRYRVANRDPFWVYQNNINAWLFRNGKLELMYLHGYIP